MLVMMKFLAPVFLGGCVYATGVSAEETAVPKEAASLEDIANGVKTTLNFAGKYTQSCFSVPNSLCFAGTEQVMTGNSVPEGLGAWLTFDHLYSADQSGNGNHMHRTPRAGPPHNGRGASAAFVKGASSKIKSSPSLESQDFTMSEMSQTPSLLLYPDSRRLSVRVTTEDSGSEGMASTGSLPMRRWTHVAVSASENRLKLFLNGMKDSEVVSEASVITIGSTCPTRELQFLRGKVLPNTEDIVVGASIENPGFEDNEISAMTLPALTGCDSCGYDFAVNSNMCGEPAAHLCSLQELYQGGIHAARINGLLNSKTEMWHSDMTAGEMALNERRLALCCASRGAESA
ncbi:hypothetical protein, conserved [Eimeria necatrix]|uniref:DUF8019 domain-containing protein n=1 Tax=Eimeria necatrix TaxID=51315 RepID=U6ME84_9EIME|nr:hypothetical protein, conserved [Eimeria necatrix]CDJ62336.1 hypothetical protein, conserved [Eimeria necatrix]